MLRNISIESVPEHWIVQVFRKFAAFVFFSIFCLTLNYTHGKNSQIVTGLFVLSAAEYF